MTYKVLNFTKKETSTGKMVANMELEGVEGMVSMWADHPNFATLNVGYTVDGSIVEKGQYKTLYAPKAPSTGSTSSFKGGMGANLMQTKADNIEHAQKAKEGSIMIASTFSSATQILTALIEKDPSYVTDPQLWQNKWVEIRYWLVKQWGNIEQKKVGGTDIDYPSNNFPSGTPF